MQVGATRNGGLAARACEATLAWNKQVLVIAKNASQIDLDTFGVDLGLGVPVATFQVKKSGSGCCMEYQVYSLATPPRLLRTITGGDFFSAADTDMDGRLEIWTDDAAAADGFEGLNLAELDSAPTIVLRFSHGELLDVSPEFKPYFDRKIAELQKELDADDLHHFKNSGGNLSTGGSFSAERLHHQRGVKAKILEIVWCYLYSGRDPQAWRLLEEMWPTADVPRIRAAILGMRGRGISAQVNGVSPGYAENRRKHARIFDAISESAGGKLDVTPPEPIMLRHPSLLGIPDQNSSHSDLLLELVIDSAGKVRSAEPAGKSTPMDSILTYAPAGWKFIPAFKDGRAVASRIRMAVSPKQ